MHRTIRAYCAFALAACAEPYHRPQPVKDTWVPYVAPQYPEHTTYVDAGPPQQQLTWRQEHPAVLHLDPTRCQDPRIKRVLDRCVRRADLPQRVWFSCPRSEFNYDDRRFAEIEMNGLWQDCNLSSEKPAQAAPRCDAGIVQAEIKRNRRDEPVQARPLEGVGCDE